MASPTEANERGSASSRHKETTAAAPASMLHAVHTRTAMCGVMNVNGANQRPADRIVRLAAPPPGRRVEVIGKYGLALCSGC